MVTLQLSLPGLQLLRALNCGYRHLSWYTVSL